MRNGFTFKNRHSSEFGVTVKTKSRPILPEVKGYLYETPAMDGSYDFTASNSDGREHYNDRLIEIAIQYTADKLEELEQKTARLAVWLRGSGDLIFDSSNTVKWTGRFISEVSFAPEHRGKSAIASAIFRARPCGAATFNTADGVHLSDALMLDSDIPLDFSQYFVKQLSYGENTVQFVNIGDFYVRPKLIFGKGASNITATYRDTKIMLSDLAGDVIIDMEKCVVTNSSGDNLMNKLQGNFFELGEGVSDINIYTDCACELRIEYAPKTIYDFDFSSIDWGDEDA